MKWMMMLGGGAAAANDETTPALVPKLRFPEFRKTEAWEPTTIGALGRFYYGKSAPKWSLSDDAPTPCVRYGELYTKFGPVILETYSRTNTDPETLRFSKGGEILIPRVGEKPEDFGKCCAYLPLKGIAIGEMISVLETKQYPLFYTYYFRNLYKQFAKVVEGQNVKNLYFAELEPLPIHRPSIPEQQKIAECLSSVDELIAAQARNVDALKTHKKGLMQQLFPREGETQPRLRFPEFQNDGEWVDDTLGAVCELYQPVTLSSSELSMTGEHLVYGANGVIGTHNEYNHEESEIAVTCRGATCGEVTITKPKSWVTGNAMIVKPRTKKLRKDFIFQYLKNHGLKAIISGSAQPQITRTGFAPLLVFFPQPDEQQRIADCLTSLDDLIAAQTQKHEALKTHKKGLMQQLFPAPTISTS
jgi:type I restriction enzyme S subunit